MVTVGKKALAAELGWSRPTLDRRLLSDPQFPVESRGDQAGGWKFELAAVKAYLEGRPPPKPGRPRRHAGGRVRRITATKALGAFESALDTAASEIARRCSLPDEFVPRIQEVINESRAAFAVRLVPTNPAGEMNDRR